MNGSWPFPFYKFFPPWEEETLEKTFGFCVCERIFCSCFLNIHLDIVFRIEKKDTLSLHFFSSLNWRSRPLLCEWADNGCLCWSKGISIIHTQLFNPWKMPNSLGVRGIWMPWWLHEEQMLYLKLIGTWPSTVCNCCKWNSQRINRNIFLPERDLNPRLFL